MRNTYPLAIGAGIVASAVMIATAAVSDRQPGDLAVARQIQKLPGGPFRTLMDAGDTIGSAWALGLIGLVLLSVLIWRRRYAETAFIVAINGLFLISPILKELIARPRPREDELYVAFTKTNFAFPSGHVFGATIVLGGVVLMSGLCWNYRRWPTLAVRAAALLVFGVIALSRVYLGLHVPSDVIGALVISATAVVIAYAIFLRYRHHLPVFLRSPAMRSGPPRIL